MPAFRQQDVAPPTAAPDHNSAYTTQCHLQGDNFADSDGNEHEVYDEEPDARWREGRWQGVLPRQLEEVTA